MKVDKARQQRPGEIQTHFGYLKVSENEKTRRVGDVFDSVAARYDLMNDLMSFGVHRLWKHFAAKLCKVRPGHTVLDTACGSGDLSRVFARRVGPAGTLVMADINGSMLSQGRIRMLDAGLVGNVSFVQCDAERLCFNDNFFDCIAISFGLRNVTRIENALKSMYRVLKPGGRLMILEFSKPTTELLAKIYDAYSFAVIPKLGKLVLNDEASYQYLVESIRQHPDQQVLRGMMETAGFERVEVYNFSGGVVAVHLGFKY